MKVDIQKITGEVLKDAYDRLVMKFLLLKEKKGYNLFAFTGVGLKVDTASVARNVAIQTAEMGNKTLYIDTCFIKGRNDVSLVSTYTEGVLEYLVEASELKDILYSTNVQNLDFISCGFAENPTSVFSSKKFDMFLESASKKYDYVFLDTSSLDVTVGAAVIASKVSGVVIVTEFNRTKKKQISYITEELESIGANIIGVVMHNVTPKLYKRFVGNYKFNKEKCR